MSEHTPLHLLLRRSGDNPAPGSTRPWLEAYPGVSMHHHIRHEGDLARVARLIGGHATGLVLSGGGARGFAHIGVLRALREAGIAVDYVAGCSAGAIVGAGIAADWDDAHLATALRAAFVEDDPLSDFTLPLVAMHSGHKVSQVLKRTFGEGDIEDLPLPFFCVSTDLSEGVLHVHERGPLWITLRATSAIPGVVPPVFHERRVLVDGGVMDNLPVEEMRHRLGGDIIAVDVGGNYRIDIPRRGIHLLVDDAELARRRDEQAARGWKPAQPRPRKVSTALKAYALLATSADKGAVRDKALLEG